MIDRQVGREDEKRTIESSGTYRYGNWEDGRDGVVCPSWTSSHRYPGISGDDCVNTTPTGRPLTTLPPTGPETGDHSAERNVKTLENLRSRQTRSILDLCRRSCRQKEELVM